MSELEQAVRVAKSIALAANVLSRGWNPLPLEDERDAGKMLELLLLLWSEGGGAPVTRLAEAAGLSVSQALSYLAHLEAAGLVRLVRTPTRVAASFTREGERVVSELLRALGAARG